MLSLSPALRRALGAAMQDGVRNALHGQAGSPPARDLREAVGITLSTAAPAAADAWGGVLADHGLSVQVTGAFSFGAPQVEFEAEGATWNCALADLLLVADDLTGPVPQRYALLVRTRLTGADATPADYAAALLDSRWPPFRLVEPEYGPERRILGAAAARRATASGTVSLSGAAPPWVLTPPTARIGRGLGEAIMQLALGRWGMPIDTEFRDDWSRTVAQLLDHTARAGVAGLRPNPRFRSLQTYAGAHGRGLVLFENRTGAPLELALAAAPAAPLERREAPISVIRAIFRPGG